MSPRSMNRARIRNEERRRRRSRKARAGAGVVAALGAIAIAAPAAEGSNFIVESKLDDGDGVCDATCTLRDAIESANANPGPDTVTFRPGLSGTITLTNGHLPIGEALEIVGPGVGEARISGDANQNNNPDAGDSRIFEINTDANGALNEQVTISGLTMREGFTDDRGGAILVANSKLTLDGVAVSDSYAFDDGGGVYAEQTALTIADSNLSDNYSGEDGGALYTDDDYSGPGTTSPLVVRDSTFADNYAASDGGGIYADDTVDSVLIERSTIAGNSTAGDGGGLMLFGPERRAVISDSTISGNAADDGGGVYVDDDYDVGAAFDNTTIADNTARYEGGGVYSVSEVAGVSLSSTIVADNVEQEGRPNDLAGTSDEARFTLGFSIVESPGEAVTLAAPAGSSQIGIDPQLGPLAANGGPTRTQIPAGTSPAIDAGVANGLTTDQRGAARTQEQPGTNRPGSDGTDIGAAELRDFVLDSPAVSARKTQRVKGKRIRVEVDVSAAERVDIEADGSIKAGGTIPLKPVRAGGEAGAKTTLSLKPRKKRGAARIARVLGKGRKARATVSVLLTDAAGNTGEDRVEVRLKAARKKDR